VPAGIKDDHSCLPALQWHWPAACAAGGPT
jgi:hypothetical protein